MKSNLANLFSSSMSSSSMGSNGDEDVLKYVAPTASTVRPDLASSRMNNNLTKTGQVRKSSQEQENEQQEPEENLSNNNDNLGKLPEVTKPARSEMIHNATVRVWVFNGTSNAQEALGGGLPLGCVILSDGGKHNLLVYNSQKQYVLQTEITSKFEVSIQNTLYMTFCAPNIQTRVEEQYTLLLDSELHVETMCKYITICRIQSYIIDPSSTPDIFCVPLSGIDSQNSQVLSEGDIAGVKYSGIQVVPDVLGKTFLDPATRGPYVYKESFSDKDLLKVEVTERASTKNLTLGNIFSKYKTVKNGKYLFGIPGMVASKAPLENVEGYTFSGWLFIEVNILKVKTNTRTATENAIKNEEMNKAQTIVTDTPPPKENMDSQEREKEENNMEIGIQKQPSEKSVLSRMAALSQAGGAMNIIQPMDVKQIRSRISVTQDERISDENEKIQQYTTESHQIKTSAPVPQTQMPDSSSLSQDVLVNNQHQHQYQNQNQNQQNSQETAMTVYEEPKKENTMTSTSHGSLHQNQHNSYEQIHSQEHLHAHQNYGNIGRMGMNELGSGNVFYKLDSMHSDIILMKDIVNRMSSSSQYNSLTTSHHMHSPGTPVSPSSISLNMQTQPAMYTKMGGKYSTEEWLGSFRMLLDDYEKLEKDSKDTPDKLATYMEKVTTLQEKNNSLMEKLMNKNEDYGTLEKQFHDKRKEFEEIEKSLTNRVNTLEDNLNKEDQQNGENSQKILTLQNEAVVLEEEKLKISNELYELKMTSEKDRLAMEGEKTEIQKLLEEQMNENVKLTDQIKTMISLEDSRKKSEEEENNEDKNLSSSTEDMSLATKNMTEEIAKLQDTVKSLESLLEERTEKLKAMESLHNQKVEATEEKDIVAPEKDEESQALKNKLQQEERQQMMQNIYMGMEAKFASCAQEDTFNSKQILKLLKKILRETITVEDEV